MALSPKQKNAAAQMQKKAATGDSAAVKWIETVKTGPSAKDYAEFFDGGAQVVGGIRRSDLAADTKCLTAKQFQIAVSMAIQAAEGKEAGVNFFAAQETEAEKGSQQGKTYVAVRDEVKQRGIEAIKVAGQQKSPSPAQPKPAPSPIQPLARPTPIVNQSQPVRRTSYSPKALY